MTVASRNHFRTIGLAAVALCVHLSTASAQTVQIDLVPLGWVSPGSNASGQPVLYNALAFASDDSLWLLYPNEANPHLIPRGQPEHSAGILHLSPVGSVLRNCRINIPEWFRTQVFISAADQLIVQANTTFQLLGAECEVVHTVTLADTHPLRSYISTDRDKLFVVTSEEKLIALDTNTLRTLFEIAIPVGVRAGEYTVAQDAAAYSASERAVKGCEANTVVRQDLKTQVVTPWIELQCSDFVILTDHLLLAKRRDSEGETLSMVNDQGEVELSFRTPPASFIDTPAFFLREAAGTSSNRIVEHFFFKKGEAVSAAVLDLSKDQLLAQIRIDSPGPIFSTALSTDGRRLAIYSGSKVEIHQLP